MAGQVIESQCGAEFPQRDLEYHEKLGYTPHAPPPVDRRFKAANLFNHGPYNTGAVPKGNLSGEFHPKYAIQ